MLGISIRLALSEIGRHFLRSFLTILGIVIGISAFVTMVTLGNGATKAIQEIVAGLGANSLYVHPSQSLGRGGNAYVPPFTIADADQIGSQIPGIDASVPIVTSSLSVSRNGRNYVASITGTTRGYFAALGWVAIDGEIFSSEDEQAGRAVCLLGAKVSENLLGFEPPVGTSIRIGRISCSVIGVMKARGDGASIGGNPDDSVIMPIKAVQRRLLGTQDIQFIQVAVNPRYSTPSVQAGIDALLRQRRGILPNESPDFEIVGTAELSQSLSNVTAIMTAFMGAVGAVSLLVGGIGIMNIMLVSVIERTREIGIRLAIGAVGREVMMQFLVESVVLSSLGGAIGLGLAFCASFGLAMVLGVPFVFDWKVNVFAFLFSGMLGVIFGYFPARRAAALNPIDALRHE